MVSSWYIYNLSTMPFWQNLELLPSSTREKAQNKPKRSKEEYAESREKVKDGVKEAKESREQNESVAEVMLYIEFNEEELKEKMMKENLQDTVGEFSSYDKKQWSQLQQAFGENRFDLIVEKSDIGEPNISMRIDLPEGNVREKIPLNSSLQEALITRATGEL